MIIKDFFCAPGRIRTLNPQSRNLVFYPVELRVQLYVFVKRIANLAKSSAYVQP